MNLVIMFTVILIAGCGHSVPVSTGGTASRHSSVSGLVARMESVAQTGILVEDLETGQVILSFGSDHLFIPASNVKVLTAAAALNTLGEGFRFNTAVLTPAKSAGGRLDWLALKGSGDPFLSLRDIDTLAAVIAKSVNRIDTLILDATVFDHLTYGPGWMWDEGSDRYAAPVGGLNLNWNTVDLFINMSPEHGQVEIISSPATSYISIVDSISFITDSTHFLKLEAVREWWNHSNKVLVKGAVFHDNLPDTLHTNIYDPVKFTGTVFKEALESRGVTVGSIVVSPSPSGAELITGIMSPALPEMTNHFLKETDNLVAETLLKRLGMVDGHKTGSWPGGLQKMITFLADSAGIDTTGFRIADGSGLSRYSLLSPGIMVDVLKFISLNNVLARVIVPALPVSGTDGTLKDRMTDPGIRGRVMAKTGSLGNVSTLSGFIHTDSGRKLVFSMMMNGFTIDREEIRNMQDQLCKHLVENVR